MNNLLAEQIIQDMNNLLAERHYGKQKAVTESRKPLKKIFLDFLEIGKPLKKIFLDFSEIGKPLKKIEF
jgi:hypothetical protein